MRKNFIEFTQDSLKKFSEIAVNIFIFLPYFFSISTLVKTLFSPWKNLMTTKTIRGFSFNEMFERFSFNLISSFIGFLMRSSIICFYFLILVFYIILLPLIFLIYILFIPVNYIQYTLQKTDQEKEVDLRKKFIDKHLLKQENIDMVSRWFTDIYSANTNNQWWKLKNLLSLPPLARDWAVGYTPTLDQYVEDLTSVGYQSNIKNAFDREKEIATIERALSQAEEANVVIVGEEGVGKHTIVDSLAKKIYEGQINNILAYKRILKLNLEKILSTTTDQKQRETILENLLLEASNAKNIIIFIDNLERYIRFEDGGVDLTIPLEKYGKTNRLQFIGITEPLFYQKFVYSNEKISRIFTKIDVYEISKDEAEKLLQRRALDFEKRYRIIIPFETIKSIIEKSDYFITNIPFPEKAINLLDSVCVLTNQKADRLARPDLVDNVLTEKTHIPTTLTETIREKLVNLESLLSEAVIQQDEAIKKLSASIRRSFLLLGKRKKPLGSFLFLGPTGVGKTETAKALARIFFGSERYLIRFDMENYQTKNEIPGLINLMAPAIRQNPFGVLLLDEFEKADPDLINIFLTLFDEGYLVDTQGTRINCKNLVVIATSNAKDQNFFAQELLNRFDGVIVFQSLSQMSIMNLANKLIHKITEDIFNLYRVRLIVSDNYRNEIVQKGYDPRYGARNLERTIRDEVEDKVAKLILEKKVKEGETINL